MISNVKFDRLIRIEIKWNKVSGKQAQLEILKISNISRNENIFHFFVFLAKFLITNRWKLCLAGLEIRKIGLLQPIQVLEETEQSKYQFGCLGCMSERIKELPPRLEYEGNGTYYTIITVKLAQEHSHIWKVPGWPRTTGHFVSDLKPVRNFSACLSVELDIIK